MIHFTNTPAAYALLEGNEQYPNTKGRVDFYEVYGGTLVVTEVYGLDAELENQNLSFWGFHIHEEKLPPLLSQGGIAWMAVYTKQFFPEEIIGRTAVIQSVAHGEIIAWDREIR